MREKLQNLEDRSWRDNLCVDGIPECEEESWGNTEELFKDTLRETLGVNKIQIERANRVGAKETDKDKTIVAKFGSCKGKQRVLNETRCQEIEDIYVYEDFSKATVGIIKKDREKVKGLRQHGKYAILVYDEIYSRDKLIDEQSS